MQWFISEPPIVWNVRSSRGTSGSLWSSFWKHDFIQVNIKLHDDADDNKDISKEFTTAERLKKQPQERELNPSKQLYKYIFFYSNLSISKSIIHHHEVAWEFWHRSHQQSALPGNRRLQNYWQVNVVLSDIELSACTPPPLRPAGQPLPPLRSSRATKVYKICFLSKDVIFVLKSTQEINKWLIKHK